VPQIGEWSGRTVQGYLYRGTSLMYTSLQGYLSHAAKKAQAGWQLPLAESNKIHADKRVLGSLSSLYEAKESAIPGDTGFGKGSFS